VVGHLSTVRDFVDVQDLVSIYWDLILTSTAYVEIFNICSGRGTVINHIVSWFTAFSSRDIEVKVDETRFKSTDIPVHYGSDTNFKKLLGWAPHTDLKDTLRAIFEDLRVK
jgi:UDP-glucose 4-epimerase